MVCKKRQTESAYLSQKRPIVLNDYDKWGFTGKMARTGGKDGLTALSIKRGTARKGAEKAWERKKKKNAGKKRLIKEKRSEKRKDSGGAARRPAYSWHFANSSLWR
jgi:hypothetical protein